MRYWDRHCRDGRVDFRIHNQIEKENVMKRNVGNIDRIVRIVAGLVILSLFFVLDDEYRWWALIGIVPLATGLVRWCPAYLPFGIHTCKLGEK